MENRNLRSLEGSHSDVKGMHENSLKKEALHELKMPDNGISRWKWVFRAYTVVVFNY